MQSFLPALLLHSLKRFTGSDEANDATDASLYSTLAFGSIVGTQMGTESCGDDVSAARQGFIVWGLVRQSLDDDDSRCFERYLPGGISPIGIFIIVQTTIAENETDFEAVALEAVHNVQGKEEIVLVYESNSQTPRMFHCKDGKVTVIEVQVVPCLHARDFYRAIGYAPLRCAVDLHVIGEKDTLLYQLEKCKLATRSVEEFYVRAGVAQKNRKRRSFRVLNGYGNDVMGLDTKPVLLKSILPGIYEDEDEGAEETKGKKKKNGNKQKNVTPARQEIKSDEKLGLFPSLEYGDIGTVDLLVSLAPSDASVHVGAPKLTIPVPNVSNSSVRHYHAHCDAVIMVPIDSSVESALALLRQVLSNQLAEVFVRIRDSPEAISAVAIHQFPLIGATFPLTLCSYSTNAAFTSDESLYDVKTRTRLHCAFLQPLNQPLFRISRGCSLAQQGEGLAVSDVLYNVHEGISRCNLSSQSQVAMVDGFYGYYHYLQQGLNDKGWGCAYRSLQTLASWLFLQHYTTQRLLTHEQIQHALVQIGDKPARFKGSTDWIGSLEVGYVLDELFGVTFRSLSVSSGAQLPEVARELLSHFQTQGTPVMMGGGQLAFTLLGVDYDPDIGVAAFLTLDPHYTGDENLSTIQNQTVTLEGYKAVPCSWRKTTTFAKNSFYNFCLPQRPHVEV